MEHALLPLLASRALLLLASALLASTTRAQGWTTAGGETVPTEGKELALRAVDDPSGAMEALLRAHGKADGPGTALAVRRDGKTLFAGAVGLADVERGVACTPTTVFDMASLAKSVTAAAIERLAEEGALALDDAVREHLPELDAVFTPVRLRHLLHHTAGIEDVDGLLVLAGWRPFETATAADEFRVLSGLRHLRFAPGTQHMYSNGGYVLLAEIVRRVAGQALPEWARERLFEPLGLASARLATSANELVSARAVPYSGKAPALAQHAPGASHGAGGFLCSVEDLARWGEELATGKTLGLALVERLRTPGTLDDGSPLSYAGGLVRGTLAGHACFQHSGSVPGGQSSFALFPELDLVVAAATNDGDGPAPYALLESCVRILLGERETAAAAGAPRSTFIPSEQVAPEASRGLAPDPALLARLTGVYHMSEAPNLVFATREGRLLLGFDAEPSIEVFPLPNGRFILPSTGYEYSFEPDQGRVTLHVSAASARRGKARDIQGKRWKPVPLDARALAGRLGVYRGEELGSFYEVTGDAEGLFLEHARHGRMPLVPFGPEVYWIEGDGFARLEFQREGEGVRGFRLEARSWNATSGFQRL